MLSGPACEAGSVTPLALTPLKFVELALHPHEEPLKGRQDREPMITHTRIQQHLVDNHQITGPHEFSDRAVESSQDSPPHCTIANATDRMTIFGRQVHVGEPKVLIAPPRAPAVGYRMEARI